MNNTNSRLGKAEFLPQWMALRLQVLLLMPCKSKTSANTLRQLALEKRSKQECFL